jgi:DNA repair protein RecO (recombination protein O)
MNWSDEGVILSVRPHGETAAIAEVFTRTHGRHLGLVHGGRSRRLRPILQVGNHIHIAWQGRLAEHLGTITVETQRAYAAEAMADALSLSGLSSLTALARMLPERDPHPNLYEITLFVLGFLDDPSVWPALMVRWELALLEEMGFGLDLTQCAATGSNDALIYVSPRTGRAVSASAGEPYRDRLLHLPPFLRGRSTGIVGPGDIAAGFRLTGHFLETRVLERPDVPLPEARSRMIELIGRQSGESPGRP